jgi:subtilisin family serine protease
VIVVGALAGLGVAVPAPAATTPARTEVVVALPAPPLAVAVQQSRVLSAVTKARTLDLSSSSSVTYLHALGQQQDALASRITRTIPSAHVRWRYQVVLDGLAVDVPATAVGQLSLVPGVASVYPDTIYHVKLQKSLQLIGADQLWVPDFSTAGQGVKIGVIDEGIDQAHPFFSPAGYTYPPGYPKGNTAFTTPKVIVARAFAPPNETWQYGNTPFDPVLSDHATHVAGIAAGDYTPNVTPGGGPLAGVAPRAYLGNYKALTVPTEDFGLDGNAPEIAAAVEAAVKDGMNIINLSIGEPEIEPARDLVVTALDNAAKAGVLSTVAAGNDGEDLGLGSITSPATAPASIAVAAVTQSDVYAPFSSSGPTPITLQMKPDVSAPGVGILSSVPPREGTWSQLMGTSMAAPHVAGGAALLKQRHPDWSVEQIKSALVETGDPVYDNAHHEVSTTREGGGLIDLPKADDPLIFDRPTGLSFGLLRTGTSATRTVQLTDAGGGSGTWTISVQIQDPTRGVAVSAPASVTVPGTFKVRATAVAAAAQADLTGFIVLQSGTSTRRIPFWLRSDHPRLGKPVAILRKAGVYKGNTLKGSSRVSTYRYPDDPSGSQVPRVLAGPEQVFRVVVPKGAANFGVVVTSQAPGVSISPRAVFPGDENHLLGAPGLPFDNDPYEPNALNPEPVVGAIAPASRMYDVVFDTRRRASAGPFTFRLWFNDRTPPTLKLVTPTVMPPNLLLVSATDAGSGVDPGSIVARIDNVKVQSGWANGKVGVDVSSLSRGRHTLDLSVSDYQEAKNMETFGPVLPNTRELKTTFTVG